MPFPAFLLPILGTALSTALAGRSSGQRTDPAKLWQQLFGQSMGTFQNALAPVQQQVSTMAGRRGAALGQDLAGSMGALGGFSSGAGRAAFSLGQSATGALRTSAESQYRQQLVDMSRANAASLLAPQQAFMESQRGGGENVLGFLAQILSGGQLGTAVQGAMQGGQQKPGAAPAGGLQANPFLQNPNILPFQAPANPMGLSRGRR